MADLYCKTCGDRVETVPFNRYKASSPKVTRHVGEMYLNNQKMSGLDPEDRAQLDAWNHPITVVNAEGKSMADYLKPDSKLGRQFR